MTVDCGTLGVCWEKTRIGLYLPNAGFALRTQLSTVYCKLLFMYVAGFLGTMNRVGEYRNILRVERRAEACRVLGPGVRAAVWFHGCSRGCAGCIAVEMNQSEESENWRADELAAWVKGCVGIEGVTLSGGEPLEQDLGALGEFLHLVKSDGRLGVIMFTGYRLEKLGEEIRREVLPWLDVLVDGPYVEALDDSRDLRGSSNQRIHFLTTRYKGMQGSFYGPECRNIEISLALDNRVVINGIPPRGLMEALNKSLHDNGYGLSFENRSKQP